MKIPCQRCGGSMVRKTQHGGLGRALMAAGLALIGLVLIATIVGAVVGIPICIMAALVAPKSRKVWRCKRCHSVVERG